ncbi:MAG TPA: branched-chain amino acid transaminase [Deinococcales bacterium]|nr:branched-chain amino acid transaminase [Deinococcales bacterium]
MTTATPAPRAGVGGDAGIKAGYIWMNGEVVPQEQATVSVLTHALHYGTSVFEGIRAYETPRGPAVFRLAEHTKRLFDSAHILRMPVPFTHDEINEAVVETVRVNSYRSCYIRPLVWRGGETLGVNPLPCPVQAMVAAWQWGAYLGEEAIKKGARVVTASWARLPAMSMPGKAKAGGNYINSALARMDAVTGGFDEALLLDHNGFVAEGSGENIFFVRDGKLHVIAHSVNLMGITRDSVIQIARAMGMEVVPTMATREELYIADEVFMTGTAAEVTPISEIDHRKVGDGTAGPIAMELRNRYLAAARGQDPTFEHWLTYVE